MNDELLKDVVLSTLAELEEDILPDEISEVKEDEKDKQTPIAQEKIVKNLADDTNKVESQIKNSNDETQKPVEQPHQNENIKNELEFVKTIQEDITILFKGLTSADLVEPERKRDLVVKYLQNLLILLDNRVKELK